MASFDSFAVKPTAKGIVAQKTTCYLILHTILTIVAFIYDFQDPKISGVSAEPKSKVRSSAMFLFQSVES